MLLRGELVIDYAPLRLAGEDLDIDYDAALAVRDLQRGVAHFAGLLAEDGAQALLGGEVRLALGRDLADEYVAAPDLGADADDAALVQDCLLYTSRCV